jgi:hypothetical protein
MVVGYPLVRLHVMHDAIRASSMECHNVSVQQRDLELQPLPWLWCDQEKPWQGGPNGP